MIVDTHVHCGPWKLDGSTDESYSFDEMIDKAIEAGVDQLVQVTGRGGDNEPSFAAFKRRPDRIAGIFGLFDPISPGVEERLAAYIARPGAVGIRVTSRNRGTERWIPDRMIDPFFKGAEKHGVAVQLFIPDEVPAIHETAKRFPGVRFLVDHMGVRYWEGRDNRNIYDRWPDLMRLAAEPNVWIKVSYFPEATRDIEGFPYPTGARYFRQLYETVGPKRLLWGSNMPPVERICTYKQSLDFVREHCPFLTPADKAAILGENFKRDFPPTPL